MIGTLGDLNASSVAPDWLNNPTPATEEERRQAIDELIGSGTGFGSNFFNKLINKWLFQRGDRYENKMFRMEWNGANDRDKIDMISSVIHDNIPYALEYGIKTKKENGYGYYYDFWKLVDRERSADYGERYQAFVIDNNFGTISSLISPVRRYLDKMFVCTDFADLLKVQVNRLVPSVDFNLLESYSGDHKYNSYIMNGQQYIVDPTWNISTTSLITDMKNRPLMYKNYEFDSKGDFVSSISRGAVGGMMRSLLAPLYTVISPRRVTAEEFLNQQ